MSNKEFVSLFEKGEVEQIQTKKDNMILFAIIYAIVAVIASFSIYYLKLLPYELMQQFGFFGKVDEMVTVLGFMILPVLLIFLFYSFVHKKQMIKVISGVAISTVLVSRIAAILTYYAKITNEKEFELSRPDTLTTIAFFVFLGCILILLVGFVFYLISNYKMAALILKIGAILYLSINAIFVIGFVFSYFAIHENHFIYSSVVMMLDVISSIFILRFVKRLNKQIGDSYLMNK